jgi:hypothetical protein
VLEFEVMRCCKACLKVEMGSSRLLSLLCHMQAIEVILIGQRQDHQGSCMRSFDYPRLRLVFLWVYVVVQQGTTGTATTK